MPTGLPPSPATPPELDPIWPIPQTPVASEAYRRWLQNRSMPLLQSGQWRLTGVPQPVTSEMRADSTHVAGPLTPSPGGVDDTASGSEGLGENNYERLAVTALAALAAIDAANAATSPRAADEERADRRWAAAAEAARMGVEDADAIALAKANASTAVQRPPAPEDAGVAAKRPRRPTTMFEEECARAKLAVAAPTAAAADPEERINALVDRFEQMMDLMKQQREFIEELKQHLPEHYRSSRAPGARHAAVDNL